jgi:Effector Associated Constant Component 1
VSVVRGPTEVSIRVDEPGSLFRWLTLDPQVRQEATVSLRPAPPADGEMGGALEVINVVLSNSIAVGGLLVAVSSWRKSRPRPPKATLERNGVRIVLEDASPETVRRVVDALAEPPAEPGEGERDGAV